MPFEFKDPEGDRDNYNIHGRPRHLKKDIGLFNQPVWDSFRDLCEIMDREDICFDCSKGLAIKLLSSALIKEYHYTQGNINFDEELLRQINKAKGLVGYRLAQLQKDGIIPYYGDRKQ